MNFRLSRALKTWLDGRGWKPFGFQLEVWKAIAQGQGGLLHATTGAGKTYAVWLGLLQRFAASPAAKTGKAGKPKSGAPALTVLWITPMRALAADSLRALQQPLPELAPGWTLGQRTGDTSSAERARQDRRWPTCLLTTPESLSLMLSRTHAQEELASVQAVVVDEWHELMGNKRGVQLQLALARLKQFNPGLMIWGMSATLGNLQQAAQALQGLGPDLATDSSAVNAPVIVQGKTDKNLVIDTLIPENPGKYSWAGHLGARMQGAVIKEISESGPTLVFTNTRSQAEIWYQLLLTAKPEWAGEIALHHGSLDKEVREWVEVNLKQGKLRAVVATSSLDLGVDFLPVERVLQIGSARGVARLLQRAGRSGHAPGRTSRITLVPTNTLELLEAAAARNAAKAGRIEKRPVPDKPMDVLVQHLVTLALGGGFTAAALFAEVRSAWSYRDLSQAEFDWALAFCERGGSSLTAYPDYHRIRPDETGVYRVPDAGLARRHRLNIGTIVGDSSLQVSYMTGGRIGTIEESFIARLRKGDCFVFAGRLLEFIRVQDMTAFVKKAEKNKGAIPSWNGGKMPLSTEMADAVLDLLQRANVGDFAEPELEAAQPMLQTQALLSALPTPATLLIETFKSREGHHLYIYPFAGRHVHMGLANLLAWRLARELPNTFSISVNDYGFELLGAQAFDLQQVLEKTVFSAEALLDDLLASLNSSELARRRFREIARVAGLIFTGYPGAAKSTKQLQASSSLFFEVFKKYDDQNLLLGQADREVLSQELEMARLADALANIANKTIVHKELKHPSPFCVPLMVERFREKLSTEQLSARLDRILSDMEKDQSAATPKKPPENQKRPEKPSRKPFMKSNMPFAQMQRAQLAINSVVISPSRINWLASLLAAAALSLSVAVLPAEAAQHAKASVKTQTGTVSRVIDGDTVWVSVKAGRKPLKVRILGVDAPEICQAGGPASQKALEGRVLGQNVTLAMPRSRSRDDYGRVLAKIELHGEDVGSWMVSRGQAWSYSYRRSDGPYAAEQARAVAARRGLFADSRAENPRLFRKRHGSCYR